MTRRAGYISISVSYTHLALTYVYGIGRSSSAKILDKAGVDKDLKVKDWTDDQAAKIREIIGAEYKVEGDLRSEIQLNIKRLMDIGCYRGVRHRIGLPVRGKFQPGFQTSYRHVAISLS